MIAKIQVIIIINDCFQRVIAEALAAYQFTQLLSQWKS